ncbi:ABC transporter substrate-binding protein [Kitasatospora aureofaciens]|uniref:ABC transporter substrate-binding protein n=1 Tax=Kitasatospora aureofaciens TaxID=1894 RepID=UPI0036F455A8
MFTRSRASTVRSAASAALAAALAIGLTACGDAAPKKSTAQTAADGCITSFDPNTDYFPVKSTLKDAQNFTIEYDNSYQVLTVKQPYPGGKPESYVLVKCGAPKPKLTGALASAPQVTVPIHSVFSGSTTHLPLLTDLGRLDDLTGVANASYVSGTEARARIAQAKVAEYAPDGTVNSEKVLAAKPDVLLTAGVDDPAYASLRQAGIPVLADAEWLEGSPLGRAEWLKCMAALTGDEAKAATLFDKISQDYNQVAAKAKGATPVKVLPGDLYQGTWSMPAGGSYVGRLLADAGATYPWANDTSTGNSQVNFEQVAAQDSDAPIWLVTENWHSQADALKADPRYANLAAVKNNNVWSANKAMGPGGGNDFYESGVTRPDLVLADLVAIVHPDLLPGHQFTYYQQLTH